MRGTKNRGFAFMTILFLILLTFTLIMIGANSYVQLLHFDQPVIVRQQAMDAAKSCAERALVTLADVDSEFGRDKKGEITIPFGMLSDYQSAYVTFNPEEGRPYSTNNLHSDAATVGYNGDPVPAHGAHILAVGRSGPKDGPGREVIYLIDVTRPGITHAAASSGELRLSGNNEAAAVETTGVLSDLTQQQMDLQAEDINEKVRSTTVASSKDSGDPLVLEGQLTLYGNAVSAAGIKQVGNDIKFLRGGLPQANSHNVEIPEISDIKAYYPDSTESTPMVAVYPPNEIFQSRNLRDGNLEITGDVNLDDALIYATGNIVINGSVTGEGGIVAEGNITITGQSSLKADSKVAVVAGGDLTINGTGAERSLFTGLLYSQGKLQASNLSIAGGLVANHPSDPEAASMEVTDSKLINLPEKTKFHISTVIKAPPVPPPTGRLRTKLRANNLELVNPDLGPLIGEDGTWNGTTPAFGFRNTVTGTTYSSLSEVPRPTSLTEEQWQSTVRDIAFMMETEFVPNFINSFLKNLTPQNTDIDTIFQLDPNQLLTISGGYNIVLRRPLDGWYIAD